MTIAAVDTSTKTRPEVDPLITRYLPVVNGHIVKNYRWIEEKGNCLVSVEDLQQIAAISLVKLAGKWDDILASLGKERDGDNALFWGYLRNNVKSDVSTFYRDHGKRGSKDQSIYTEDTNAEGDEKDADTWMTVRTAVRSPDDTAFGQMLWNDIVDFFELMPTRDKILFALRYFDELAGPQMADVLSIKKSTVGSLLDIERKRWKDFAANLILETPKPFTPRQARAWEPPESLLLYVQTRHRKDLHEYLWYVTQAFRMDVKYLTDILGASVFATPKKNAWTLSPYQRAQIDRLHDEGRSQRDIALDTNLTVVTVMEYLASRHTI